MHETTTEYLTLVSRALAVAGAPEKYPIMELKGAAIVLENEQKSQAFGKHCSEFVMDRITTQLTNLARVIRKLGTTTANT